MKFIKKLSLLIITVLLFYTFYSYTEVNKEFVQYNKKYSNVKLVTSFQTLNNNYYMFDINHIFNYDKNGYPIYNVNGNDIIHPTQLIHSGLDKLSQYNENKDQVQLDSAITYGKYLLNSIKTRKFNNIEYGIIPIDFFNKHYPFAGNSWISSMTQGQALSFFLRLHQVSQKAEFLQAATLIFNSFQVPLSSGGVVFEKNGFLWTEEVVSIPPTHILNGNIFALLGIYDYWLVTQDERAHSLFHKGIESIRESLERYSFGKWSYYDDPVTGWAGLSHPGYQVLHPILLDILYNITGDSTFQEYSQRWREGQDSVWAKVNYVFLKNYFRMWRIINRNNYTTIPYE